MRMLLVASLFLLISALLTWKLSIAREAPSAGTTTQPSKPIPPAIAEKLKPDADNRVHLSEAEWKQILTEKQFSILRKHNTELAFDNEYFNTKADGVYQCAGCGQELFDSRHKYDSGTGWPSFYQPAGNKVIGESVDRDLGYVYTEVHCSRCGGHQGHVFNDGPQPTGLRYCINSAALRFAPRAAPEK